jgi:hypothetical protein
MYVVVRGDSPIVIQWRGGHPLFEVTHAPDARTERGPRNAGTGPIVRARRRRSRLAPRTGRSKCDEAATDLVR